MQRILAAFVDAQDRQKTRVSRFLHDEVGQILSAVGLQLDGIRLDVKDDSPEIAARLEKCLEHLGQAIDQVRALSQEMSPAAVGRSGLTAALQRLVETCSERHSNIHLSTESSIRLPREVATALYKIAECALDNAVVHAGADRIDIIVKQYRGGVLLEIRDDGGGFDPQSTPKGLGLLLIDHFAKQARLRSGLSSVPGRGTIVKAHCPAAQLRHGFESPPR